MNQNSSFAARPFELWGGIEYTCNRVGDSYFDQMHLSGHAERVSDIERIAELGIKTLRYGLLWERHELDTSWRWSDERMTAMQQHGIRPIVSLVHHGSGPQHTSLLDEEFPQKLAAYASEVAARYPWVDAYTPVNEPHTTARFSGLYALWYPHHQSRRSYLRALLNQTKATVLSMQAIRRVRPDAQLVQTDDLGRIWGTEALSATCDLLNERRWLPFDLLCGRVTRQHPLFSYMVKAGIFEEEILWFAANPCPPNTVGVNYYLTSDRYLDHRIHLYPRDRVSAEGPFVDVEAVRVRPEGIAGFGSIVTEAWRRYGIPVAVTEVHLGGDVREQIRWVAEASTEIASARASGVDCRAMTLWALLGSFFWNSLVTCANGHYEAGAFDVRSGQPAPTELAKFIQQMASGGKPEHPALATQGWWRRDDRIHFPHEQGTDLAA